MLIQNVRLQWISQEKGYGLFAEHFIPKGTITFVNDALDIYLDPHKSEFQTELYKKILDKYAYNSIDGKLVVCWDFAKYMNHCCFSNTLTTGYGFDIAVTDINPGEEITTDYGVIATEHTMIFNCSKENCRKKIDINSFESCISFWDSQIQEALKFTQEVSQPLYSLIDEKTRLKLESYLGGKLEEYQSVSMQKPSVT
ncbi:MAG: SET domain-containing protein [Halobacteriovoraceae bacterium]|nr:SET domain-containing protein [Halobacteriovoraceae bacterium]